MDRDTKLALLAVVLLVLCGVVIAFSVIYSRLNPKADVFVIVYSLDEVIGFYVFRGKVVNGGDATAHNVTICVDTDHVHMMPIRNIGNLDAGESCDLDFSFEFSFDFTSQDITVVWD